MPELAAVPEAHIHTPWVMTPVEQRACGVVIGEHYPAPLVEHAAVKARTLAAYQQAQTRAG